MKKLKLLLISTIVLLLLGSCASTPEQEKKIDLISVFDEDAPIVYYLPIDMSTIATFEDAIGQQTVKENYFMTLLDYSYGMMGALNFQEDNEDEPYNIIVFGDFTSSFIDAAELTLENGWNTNIESIDNASYIWFSNSDEISFFIATNNILFISDTDIKTMILSYHNIITGDHSISPEVTQKNVIALDFIQNATGGTMYIKDAMRFLNEVEDIPFDLNIDYAVVEVLEGDNTSVLKILAGFKNKEDANDLFPLLQLAQLSSKMIVTKTSDTTILIENIEIDMGSVDVQVLPF